MTNRAAGVGGKDTMSEWISVDDRLPDEDYEDVIVAAKSGQVTSAYMVTDYLEEPPKRKFDNEWERDMWVTHWMPWPKHPREDSGD